MSTAQPEIDDPIAAIAKRYRPAIHAFFSRRISDRAEAEDLTQEVLVSLARRGEVESIGNIEGYVFQIAANLLRQRWRQAHRRPELRFDGFADEQGRLVDELSPERVMLGRDAWALLVQALQELPERSRTIFVLNRFEEMTGREIAIRLGVSVSLVEKEMIKAIVHLRERLA